MTGSAVSIRRTLFFKRLQVRASQRYPCARCTTMVVDGWWSIVGSSDLDMRSWLHNDETCVVVYQRAFGDGLQRQFEQDLGGCQELSRRRWRRRPWIQRLRERGTRPLYHWL